MRLQTLLQFLPFTALLLLFFTSSTQVTSSKVVKVLRGSLAASSYSNRIFGGSDAPNGSAPHQVALFRNGYFTCGGSLIGLKTVLCAAHCVFEDENTPSKFIVRYGSLQLYNGTEVKVTSIDRHPQYSPLLTDYDVAILHLSEEIVPGPNAGVIPLATETPANGSLVTITGFGLKNLDEPLLPAENLQLAEQMVVMDHDQCEIDWSDGGIPITDRILCIISDNQTALPGDSGGPMVYNGKLVGVTSFIMINFIDLTIMDGYMNVVTLRGWIEEHMNSGAAEVSQSVVLAFIFLVGGRLVQRGGW